MLNPYALSPNTLADISKTKREIASLSDLFVPRQNRSKPRIAPVLSYPTEHYSQAVNSTAHDLIRDYATALDFSHHDIDVVLEEQLPEGRLNEYNVLVAAGVSNVYDGTGTRLRGWVEAGGTLILGGEAMRSDEHNNPQTRTRFLGLEMGDLLVDAPAPFRAEASL